MWERGSGQNRSICWLVALLLAAMPAVLFLGFTNDLHDGRIHQVWGDQVARAIASGGGYPRWFEGMNGGLGSPTMFFYPLLPYLAAVPIVPVFGAGKALALGAAISVVVGAVAMKWLLQGFVRASTAWSGATLYVIAPYCLGTDLYTRGAYTEYWAFAWLPVVLLGVMKLRGSGGLDIGGEILESVKPLKDGKRQPEPPLLNEA